MPAWRGDGTRASRLSSADPDRRNDEANGSERHTILPRLTILAVPLTLLAVLGALLPVPARAAAEQSSTGPHAEVLEDEFNVLELFDRITKLKPRIRLVQDFTIDERYDGAAVDSATSGLRASVIAPLSRKFALRLTGRFDVSAYEFRGESNFLDTGRIPADPFDTLYSNVFRIEGRYSVHRDWILVGGADLGSNWESGSRYVDAIDGGSFFGAGRIFGDAFSIVAGMRVGSRVGRSGAQLGPIVQFGWRVNDRLEIEMEGLGLKVAYRAIPDLTVFVVGSWESSSYRLEDRGETLEGETLGKAILRDRSAPVQVGLSWKIQKHWRLRASLGAVAYQKYSVLDENRENVDNAIAKGAAFTGGLELEFRF